MLCDCLKDMHLNLGIAHLDFKLENAVFDNNRGLKIIDMESSVPIKARIKGMGGTVGYNAPERYRRTKYSAKYADMFSLGAAGCVLMAETMAEYITGVRDFALFSEIIHFKCNQTGEIIPEELTQLLFNLLSTDPL